LIDKLNKVGNAPKPSSPEEFKARLAVDIAQWKRVVEDARLALI
jgi:tripartite-type tricarboxylate transporter receptor subunit TctC